MEINLMVMWEVFLKRLWAVILGFVLAAAGAFCYCEFLVTPSYRATAAILVTNGAITVESVTDVKNSVSGTDISASSQLVNTIVDILQTKEVYRATAKASNGKYDYSRIVGTASVSRKSEESLFVNISFNNSDGKTAIDLANLFAETACDYIPGVIPYSTASVVEKATSAGLTYPHTYSTMGIAGIVAAAVIYLLFFLVENNNKTIRNEEDFAKNFDIPIIGAIPDFENSETSAYTIYKKGKGYNNV